MLDYRVSASEAIDTRASLSVALALRFRRYVSASKASPASSAPSFALRHREYPIARPRALSHHRQRLSH